VLVTGVLDQNQLQNLTKNIEKVQNFEKILETLLFSPKILHCQPKILIKIALQIFKIRGVPF
jgi:hypothetical protein